MKVDRQRRPKDCYLGPPVDIHPLEDSQDNSLQRSALLLSHLHRGKGFLMLLERGTPMSPLWEEDTHLHSWQKKADDSKALTSLYSRAVNLVPCFVQPFKACFQSAQFRKPKPRLELEHLPHTVPKLTAEAMQCSLL